MMKSLTTIFTIACASAALMAQDSTANARAAYQQQQALAEVPRLVQQFDLLVQNQDAIAARLVKLEGADAAGDLRAEVAALRAEVAELKAAIRRERDAMRQEIVQDLAGRISKMSPPAQPAAAPRQTPAPAHTGNVYEHTVEKGQTLSLIAKGFDTTVPKILAVNPGLKANALRVGQKIYVPAEETPKQAKGKK